MNRGLNKSSTTSPLMNVIRNVGVIVLSQWHTKIYNHIRLDKELEMCHKNHLQRIEILNEVVGNSMNHFEALQVRVHGKMWSRMLSSNKELDTHHRWYMVMWVVGSSQCFSSNLGISTGILTGTSGQARWCCMGLFVSLNKSSTSSVSKKETVYWKIDYGLKVTSCLY